MTPPGHRLGWQITQGLACACRGMDDLCVCQNENPWPRPHTVAPQGGQWLTIEADRVLYLDEGRERVLCDRLPSPVTLVLKLSAEPLVERMPMGEAGP